jgi:hypothetical protein
MVAATYGCRAALCLLLSLPSVDVNRRWRPDGTTTLHCAASGGSPLSLLQERTPMRPGPVQSPCPATEAAAKSEA